MPLTNAGRDHLAGLAAGVGTNFASANAHIGVGDSTTEFAAAQTDLVAATNKERRPATADRTDNAIEFVATFNTEQGNFVWNEWGVFNDASAGVMLNRKVESLGEKTDSQSWEITATVSIEHPA